MSINGCLHDTLSLLNATILFTKNENINQDHNSLNDAKMLKTLYENIGEPNIDNLIEAEKIKFVKETRQLFINRKLKNKELVFYLKNRGSLKGLSFKEIYKYTDENDFEEIRKNVKRDYWLLSDKIFDNSISIKIEG